MNTEKLYYENSHASEFDATVTDCFALSEGGYAAILDKTLFFPEGGGQPSDVGKIQFEGGETQVTHVAEKESNILHICDAYLPVGTSIHGIIDYDLRFRRMQCHSGEHIISGIAHSMFGSRNVGFHMGSEDVTIDFDTELDADQVRLLEVAANEAVWKNVPFRNLFPTAEELEKLDYRSKKELSGQVRLVLVEGYDLCACCAPHVSFSGEIGIIRIISFIRYKGGVRLHVLCGASALEYIQKVDDQAAAIAKMLSLKHHEILSGVVRLNDELTVQKRRLSSVMNSLIERVIGSLSQTESNIVIIGASLDGQDMLALANKGAALTDHVCAVFSAKQGGFSYVMSSSHDDLRAMSKEINSALDGRGGGSPEMIRGSCSCSEKDILAYFKVDNAVRLGV